MTIDKVKLKALADEAKGEYMDWVDAGKPWPVWNSILVDLQQKLTPDAVLALLAEIERLEAQVRLAGVAAEMTLHEEVGRAAADYLAVSHERDQLKAENEAMRKAMGEISVQVDGNIRCAVRDVVNCRGDVQDIYDYCDTIDEIIDAAMAKEVSHG